MPRPNYQSVTATGTYLVPIDAAMNPTDVAYAVYFVGGATATYGIQVTFDALDQVTATLPGALRWFDVPATPTGTTTQGFGSITVPATAVRLNVAAISGTIEFKVVQGYTVGT